MAVAKAVKGETVPAARVSDLTALARDAMQARGKAELGGKTVLDSLDAVARPRRGTTRPKFPMPPRQATSTTRSTPSATARPPSAAPASSAEKSVGMDDPGMLAMARIEPDRPRRGESRHARGAEPPSDTSGSSPP
jgi:phosphoenolpyruvate---glycerone phosphotransferase subunit DhaL